MSRPGIVRRTLGVKRNAIAPAFRGSHDKPPNNSTAGRTTDLLQPVSSVAPVSIMHGKLLSVDPGRRASWSTAKDKIGVSATPIWRTRGRLPAISEYASRLPLKPEQFSLRPTNRARHSSADFPPIKNSGREGSPINTRSSDSQDASVTAVGRDRTTRSIGGKVSWNQVAAAPIFRTVMNAQRGPIPAAPERAKASGFDHQGQSARQRTASAPSGSLPKERFPARAGSGPEDNDRGSSRPEDSNGPTESAAAEIHLDGAILGQWVSDHIERLLTHLPTSPTFLDPSSVALQPGMPSRI